MLIYITLSDTPKMRRSSRLCKEVAMPSLGMNHSYKLVLCNESIYLVHQNLNHWFTNNLVLNNSLTHFWVNWVFTSNNTFSAVCFLAVHSLKHKLKCFYMCVTNQLSSGEATNIFLWVLWFAINSNVMTGGDFIHSTLVLMIHEQWAQWASEDTEHLWENTLYLTHTHTACPDSDIQM